MVDDQDYSSRMDSDTIVLSGPEVMLGYGPGGGRRQVQRIPFPS